MTASEVPAYWKRNEFSVQMSAYTGRFGAMEHRKTLDEIEQEFGPDIRLAFEDLKAAMDRLYRLRDTQLRDKS